MKIEDVSNYQMRVVKVAENDYLDIENQHIIANSIVVHELGKDGLVGNDVSWCIQSCGKNKKFRIVPNSTHGRFLIAYTRLLDIHKITLGSNEFVDFLTAATIFPKPCVVVHEDSNDGREMNKITINGKTIECSGSNSVVIRNGQIIVDGETIGECNRNPNVIIEGNVNSLACDGSVEVRGNTRSIDCGGSCNVTGNVEGDIDAGGSVNCKNVTGNIDAGGSVHCSFHR